jgi:hypothetical protein
MKDFLSRIASCVLQRFVRPSEDHVYSEGGLDTHESKE